MSGEESAPAERLATVAGLLAELGRRQVAVRAEGDRLLLRGPKGAVDERLRAAVAAVKQDLLRHLHGGRPPLVRIGRGGRLPLSFAQERLWFLQQFDPGDPVFNLTSANRFAEPIDAAVLERSLAEILRRHETLRTTFAVDGGQPHQVVAPPGEFRLPRVDLTAMAPAAAEEEARRVVREEAGRAFDLARGPLVTFRLLRMPAGGDIALVNVHHTIGDYGSGTVMYREVAALYDAFLAGRASPLPELPIQYADYAAWQRAWMEGEPLAEQLAYWTRQLAGTVPLDLPVDRPRPAVQTHHGSIEFADLPAALGRGVAALARSERATPFAALLAAFQVLLWRWSGQEDVVVGSPVGTRSAPELEGLIGNFVNNLVLRGDLTGNPTFRQLLARTRQVVRDGVSHQDLPFEKLVEALRVERDLSRPPLFQVLFDYNVAPADTWSRAARGFELVDRGRVAFDLSLHLVEEPDGTLRSRWEYNSDLFDRGTVRRMAAQYHRLLAGILAGADRRLADLPWLPEEERRRVVGEWNRTERAAPPATVADLFAAQAARTPAAAAVEAGAERLSYAELDARAERLARLLEAAGAGPERLVGIALPRSADLLVAVLAVHKAGAAYLPLDPGFPAVRLAYMIADSGCALVVTRRELAGLLAAQPPALPAGSPAAGRPRLLCLDEVDLAGAPRREPGALPRPVRRRAGPEDLAYVLYTSGSTGRPKGVAVEHRAVVTFLRAIARRGYVRPDDRLLAVTTLSFDISVLELLLPLTLGATVVIATGETAGEGALLLAAAVRSGATVMQATPATWRLLLDALDGAPEGGGPVALRALCGGEAMPRELAERLLARGASLVNLYGPTEATVWATAQPVAPGGAGAVPIGAPLDNYRIYILDRDGRPLPAGVPGSLSIGGEGLARGYLGRPALTAERFVPDPDAPRPGARRYETGDLARWLADGTVEYLGRDDHQVKIRGFRIELGEIEATLCLLPQIRQAVAKAVDWPGGDRRLVAFLVPAGAEVPAVGELRAFLRERLPEYMVPSGWQVLSALPLTPNGKLDRKALVYRAEAAAEIGSAFLAPRDETERELVEIWRALLPVERVGVRDSFFELGGHSLLATQVLSRIHEAFEVEVPLRRFFEGPTVEALAAAVAAGRWLAAAAAPGAAPRGEREVLDL